MLTRTITCKHGPLDGKTYDIPATQETIPTEGGTYKVAVKGNTATWKADA